MNCKSFYAFVAGALSTISHRNYLNHLQLPPWFVYAAMRMKTTSDRVHKWVMSLKRPMPITSTVKKKTINTPDKTRHRFHFM